MSCCGEPADRKKHLDAVNRAAPSKPTGVVTQQPGRQPTLSPNSAPLNGKELGSSALQQTPISLPPLAHRIYKNSGQTSTITDTRSLLRTEHASFLNDSASTASTSAFYGASSSKAGSSSGHRGLRSLSEHSYGLDSRPNTIIHSSSGQSDVKVKNQLSALSPSNEASGLSVAIDFGTTFSGVAYGSSRIASGKVQQILNWPGSFETFRKIPTCLVYGDVGQVLCWGLEAKDAGPTPYTTKCEWFKLFLEPQALRDPSVVDPQLPTLPPGKTPFDVIVDFLSYLWEYAKQQITKEIGAVADLDTAEVWLTVPAAWDLSGCQMMRDAAIAAGLVRSAKAGDTRWRDRLRIISEPEAAAVYCAQLTELHKLKPSQNFMICDAGGGTVDLAIYKITGALSNLEIAEMCARSGRNCGSLFLDLRFRELVRTLLADHPAHLDAASIANFVKNFSETDKLTYNGEKDDASMFRFSCFNVEDPDDPTVGLINGDLVIPGNLLRREVFDPVVSQVLELIEEQSRKIDQKLDAILLVGGFSGSEYLFRKVEERFGSRVSAIARPSDCDAATLRGAAQYGLTQRTVVSSIVAPQSYMMKVKLPAEPEDWLKRPAYIHANDTGLSVCENRLQYLVAKGAIMHKGQRLIHRFCKFSQTAQDRMFVATLYVSDTDQVMRYTDEGEIRELCDWTIDLGILPRFEQNAEAAYAQGFYTEFELAIEVDSVEVRGVLVCEGQDWGQMVFAYRN